MIIINRVKFLVVLSIISIIIVLATIVLDFTKTSPTQTVGVLSSNSFRLSKVKGLKDGLTEYGFYTEENVRFLVKNAEGNREKLLPLAKELIGLGVNVIVTTGRIETEIAKKVTRDTDIPVVFMGLTAAKHDNLLQDLLHPKLGITGVQNDHAALSGKRLELLSKLLPKINKVLVISDPRVIPTEESISSTKAAAKILGLELEIVSASSSEDISDIFINDLNGIDAILLLPSFFLENEGAKVLAPLAINKKLPIMGVENNANADLFAVYGATSYDQGKQAARILAKILRGDKVEDIPVEPPTDLKLTVDLKVAKKISIDSEIDGSFFSFAEVINIDSGDNNEP